MYWRPDTSHHLDASKHHRSVSKHRYHYHSTQWRHNITVAAGARVSSPSNFFLLFYSKFTNDCYLQLPRCSSSHYQRNWSRSQRLRFYHMVWEPFERRLPWFLCLYYDENKWMYIYIFLFTQKAGPKDVAVVDISWAIGKFLYNFSFSFYLLTMFYRHPLTPQYWYPGREKGRHLGASFLLFVSFTNDVL